MGCVLVRQSGEGGMKRAPQWAPHSAQQLHVLASTSVVTPVTIPGITRTPQ